MKFNPAIIEKVRATQDVVRNLAPTYFDKSDLDHLRVLVRLTIEFDDYIAQTTHKSPEEIEYRIDSIFSGIDSFTTLYDAYKVANETFPSQLNAETIHLSSLREKFLFLYREFETENAFAKKCRLLLDLFKIQIIYAGIFY